MDGSDAPADDDTDAALAAFGLQRLSAPRGDTCFWLWPQHVPALELWAAVQTQWRHGFEGPTGLDYAGVRASPAFRALGSLREQALADVCVMERGALQALGERKQQQQQQRRRGGCV